MPNRWNQVLVVGIGLRGDVDSAGVLPDTVVPPWAALVGLAAGDGVLDTSMMQ